MRKGTIDIYQGGDGNQNPKEVVKGALWLKFGRRCGLKGGQEMQ